MTQRAKAPPGEGHARATQPPLTKLPLSGKTVVVDPGHNPTNHLHIAETERLVPGSTRMTRCDDTGTATRSGYAEARFNLDVSRRIRDLLITQGARVRLTHDGDRPWGPCVDERARIPRDADADAVVSVHADGSLAPRARGFHIIIPVGSGARRTVTREVAASSRFLGEAIRTRYAEATSSAPAGYVGDGSGLVARRDLVITNLSTAPTVLVECANMANAEDALLLENPAWRQRAARGITAGIAAFLARQSQGGSVGKLATAP
ncbi:N-acetylmuramoyl-L-alanine amidase [Streptomyces sp. NPDC091376]|uniref:N-acetylmuramoyl-L-alanine amidase n=1 Tax=Streptomyces sp. NPDC091376 TaxID=3365994 RepID=UPI003815BCB9